MYRPQSQETKELLTLHEEDKYFTRDEDFLSEECDVDSVSSEEGKGVRGVRGSVSLEIYGLQRNQHVHFSNREYYRRLEELKRTHLRNMAELERMYVSQGKEEEEDPSGPGRNFSLEMSSPRRSLQRINSQEELDFHDTSSGSDQSELFVDDSMSEGFSASQEETSMERDVLMIPVQMSTKKPSRFQPKPSSARVRPNAKVTVPKPFHMMLREEDRKRRKVRTRSEIELENSLLKRELDELRECQKKFRASPAPAHIHLPLYDSISCRTSTNSTTKRLDWSRSRTTYTRSSPASAKPKPFHFLERERRKKEEKIVAELSSFGQKEERHAFKARPIPSSVYRRTGAKGTKNSQCSALCSMEREPTEGQRDPNSDLEQETDPHDSLHSSKPQ
uniref:Protein FAM161A n=2 Tax=Gouania willdenowi TaxID=441366 RepID=A0A8C5HPS3_GOUWI